ncbi:MAG: hypothetical protein WCK51_04985 [Armatimonadota bacterium]
MNSGSRLDQADLLNEQVHPDELQELLARLAATDTLFAEPVPTIRDVAEATDASPLLIGRILSELRKDVDAARLIREIDDFRARLSSLEQKVAQQGSNTRFEIVRRYDQIGAFDYEGSYRRYLALEASQQPTQEENLWLFGQRVIISAIGVILLATIILGFLSGQR